MHLTTVPVHVSTLGSQGPHVWDEELIWLLLLYIMELEVWEDLCVEDSVRETDQQIT